MRNLVRSISISISLFLFLTLANAHADEPVAIEVYPPQVQLDSARDRQRLIVQAVYADGRTADVTAAAAFTPSDARLVAIDTNSLRPLADGAGKNVFRDTKRSSTMQRMA